MQEKRLEKQSTLDCHTEERKLSGINPNKDTHGLLTQKEHLTARPDEPGLRQGLISSLVVNGFLLIGITLNEVTAAGIVPASRTAVGAEKEKPCQENSAAAEKGDRGFSLTVGTKRCSCNCSAPSYQAHSDKTTAWEWHYRCHTPATPSGEPGTGVKPTHTFFQYCSYQGTWADQARARCFQCSPGQEHSHPALHTGPPHPVLPGKTQTTLKLKYTLVPLFFPSPLYPSLLSTFFSYQDSPRNKALWVSQQDGACHFRVILISYMQSTPQHGDFAGRLLWGKGGASRDKN